MQEWNISGRLPLLLRQTEPSLRLTKHFSSSINDDDNENTTTTTNNNNNK
jgi:hypothetical protein